MEILKEWGKKELNMDTKLSSPHTESPIPTDQVYTDAVELSERDHVCRPFFGSARNFSTFWSESPV